MGYPRFLLAAPASGSGKTLITCGILQAFCDRGLRTVSFKCGPDYIDPMFHSRVIGTKSRNLDTFFTDERTTRYLLAKNAAEADISVIEGVMGYYDGLGGVSAKASAYDLARVTETPVVLIVNCKGMSLSAAALLKGYLEYRQDSRIRGVILNQMPEMLYPQMRLLIEEELHVRCYGFVPVIKEWKLESRHLGLVLPGEVEDLQKHLQELAKLLEQTLDLDGLLELAETAKELPEEIAAFPGDFERTPCGENARPGQNTKQAPVVAVARDEAFCFIYEDNLELLQELGAKLEYFSPLRDEKLPEADGLLLCGGYPELYSQQLTNNRSMRRSIKMALESGMPCMAECGGFMYLQQEMEDMNGAAHEMVGFIPAKAYRTGKLGRFGYITLQPQEDQMLGMEIGEIRGHEFHYFDSTNCGTAFCAEKPLRKRRWECIWGTENCIAGFPHLYYHSNPRVPQRFLEKCAEYHQRKAGK